jgi:hypothetical protein
MLSVRRSPLPTDMLPPRSQQYRQGVMSFINQQVLFEKEFQFQLMIWVERRAM